MNKILGVSIIASMLTGCFAGVSNEVNKSGGFFGSYPADYIIVNTTGDLILDVYKLRNVYVSENAGTDGMNFKHPLTGSHVTIQGDVKVIRNPSAYEWDSYDEYHADIIFMEELRRNKK